MYHLICSISILQIKAKRRNKIKNTLKLVGLRSKLQSSLEELNGIISALNNESKFQKNHYLISAKGNLYVFDYEVNGEVREFKVCKSPLNLLSVSKDLFVFDNISALNDLILSGEIRAIGREEADKINKSIPLEKVFDRKVSTPSSKIITGKKIKSCPDIKYKNSRTPRKQKLLKKAIPLDFNLRVWDVMPGSGKVKKHGKKELLKKSIPIDMDLEIKNNSDDIMNDLAIKLLKENIGYGLKEKLKIC